jgi:nucleotide-binding universal stress UspA family protein
MARHPVVAAYNATDEAADGLALAELLARLTGSELVVARVLRDMIDRPSHGRLDQLEVRRQVMETRRSVVAVVPDEADADIVPLLDPNLARSLHALAESEDAAFLVVGSTHLRGLGRRLLGGSAQLVVDGARCPVAVASPGFRDVRAVVPPVVTVAYDGKPHSRDALAVGALLAPAAEAILRVVTGGDEPGDLPGLTVPAEEVERVAREGDVQQALVDETASTGLLVMGSHGRGPVRRALLGSVSAHVIHHAHCPVVVCPPAA